MKAKEEFERLQIVSFNEALKVLGIEEYKERIFHSNPHGELMHLRDYVALAMIFEDDVELFQEAFEIIVKGADEHMENPDVVFEHILAFFAYLFSDED